MRKYDNLKVYDHDLLGKSIKENPEDDDYDKFFTEMPLQSDTHSDRVSYLI